MNSGIRYGVIFLIGDVPFFHMYDGGNLQNGIETVLEHVYYDGLLPNEIILTSSKTEVSFNDDHMNEMYFGVDDNTDAYFDEVIITYHPILKHKLKTDLEMIDMIDLGLIDILINQLIETCDK